MVKGLVSAGFGVTLIPEVTMMDSVPRSSVYIPITGPEVQRDVGIITPSEREIMPAERMFRQFVIKFLQTLTGFTR